MDKNRIVYVNDKAVAMAASKNAEEKLREHVATCGVCRGYDSTMHGGCKKGPALLAAFNRTQSALSIRYWRKD